MNYFLLIFNLVIIIEFLKKFNYLSFIDSLFKIIYKSMKLISKKNISDHWKEKAIPQYSFLIIKSSLRIVLILCLSFSSVIISSLLFNDFSKFLFSIHGTISAVFFGYFYICIYKCIRRLKRF